MEQFVLFFSAIPLINLLEGIFDGVTVASKELTSSPNCFSNCSINFVAKPKPRKSRSIATCQTNKVSNEVGCLNPDTKPITLSSHSATIDVSLKYLLHIK